MILKKNYLTIILNSGIIITKREVINMTEEEIIRAKYIGSCITFKDICSNYKYLTEKDLKLYERYLKYCVDNNLK